MPTSDPARSSPSPWSCIGANGALLGQDEAARRHQAAIRSVDLRQPWLRCLSSAAKARPVEHRSATLLRVWPLSSDSREPPRPTCLPERTGCGSTDGPPTERTGGSARRVASVVRLRCEPHATSRLRLGEQRAQPGHDGLVARLWRTSLSVAIRRPPAGLATVTMERIDGPCPCDARVGGIRPAGGPCLLEPPARRRADPLAPREGCAPARGDRHRSSKATITGRSQEAKSSENSA